MATNGPPPRSSVSPLCCVKPRHALRFATYNVNTLSPRGSASKELVAADFAHSVLARHKLVICGLQETHWLGSGRFTAGGHTFLFSGNATGRAQGVALALGPGAAAALLRWEALGPRLMYAVLQLEKDLKLWVVVGYAPTDADADEAKKDAFYEALGELVGAATTREVVLILGDFNAQVGSDYSSWAGTMGRHSAPRAALGRPGPSGTGQAQRKCSCQPTMHSGNGLRLLSFCRHHGLVVASTLHQRRRRYKITWRHPRPSASGTAIDHILISAHHRSSITQARVYRSVRYSRPQLDEDCSSSSSSSSSGSGSSTCGAGPSGTPHNLLGGTLHLRLSTVPRAARDAAAGRFATQRLQHQPTALAFALECSNGFEALVCEEADEYSAGCSIILAAASKVLGPAPRPGKRRSGELDAATRALIDAKAATAARCVAVLDAGERAAALRLHKQASRRVSKAFKRLGEAELEREGRQLEQLVAGGKSFEANRQLRRIVGRGEHASPDSALVDSLGKRVTEPEAKAELCAVFFDKVYNCAVDVEIPADQPPAPPPPPEPPPSTRPPPEPPPPFSKEWAHSLPVPGGTEWLHLISTEEPTHLEVVAAISMLSNNKSPGVDGVTAELLQHGGDRVVHWLHRLILRAWDTGKAPLEWKRARIVLLHKGGSLALLDNYRGISLLDVCGKVYTKLLHLRLRDAMDANLSECQMGFRSQRSCTDATWVAAHLTTWSKEHNTPLYICFVDLKKAYDSVNRRALWFALLRQGVPPKLVDLLEDLHSGSTATIKAFGAESRAFGIHGGVRQGCNIAPTLFNIFLDFVVQQAAAQIGPTAGVKVAFAFKGRPFLADVGELPDHVFISMLLYADDMVLFATTPEEIERYVRIFEATTQRWGLAINVGKTKLWCLASNNNAAPPCPEITIRGTTVQVVEDFTYLGTALSTTGSFEHEVNTRLARGHGKFAQMRDIFQNKSLKVSTKMLFYRSFVVPTLLYGCESWALDAVMVQKLHVLHMNFLRRILGISIMDKVPNSTILQQCGIPDISSLMSRIRTRWIGHVARMEDNRLPKQILFGRLPVGHRGRGRPPAHSRVRSSYAFDLGSMCTKHKWNKTRGDKWWGKEIAGDRAHWTECIDITWPRKPPDSGGA